jgi:hypothetical protein
VKRGTLWPCEFSWIGDVMVPIDRHMARAKHQYVDGQVYRLVHEEERSAASHSHYFACIHEAWVNLPHGIADRFLNVDHLRAWCLIKCGYADHQSFVLQSEEHAVALAGLVGIKEPYAVILVDGCVVRIYTAQSQSRRSMGAKEFQASKQSVLDLLASMTGATPKQLEDEGGERRYG